MSNIPERHCGLILLFTCHPCRSLSPNTRGSHDSQACWKVITRWMQRACHDTHSVWMRRLVKEGRCKPSKENSIHELQLCQAEPGSQVKSTGNYDLYLDIPVNIWDETNCTSIMYWSTICSSVTGPLWDLYISTSSTVGTYLEQKNESTSGALLDVKLPYLGFPVWFKRMWYKNSN